MTNIHTLLNKPKIIAVVADINQGKSMLLYNILSDAMRKHSFKLYYYGLRIDIKGTNSQRIYSIQEMESIRDSVIIVDELSSLWDLDNRKAKRIIENSLRLINHNNNILILCGTPENFKKFVSGKVNEVFFKQTTIADFINGSTLKHLLTSYNGYERGAELLNLRINEALHYNGQHWEKVTVEYLKQYDSKAENVQILVPKENKK